MKSNNVLVELDVFPSVVSALRSSIRVRYTCSAVSSSNCLVLGANTGGLYLFTLNTNANSSLSFHDISASSSLQFIQLIPSPEASAGAVTSAKWSPNGNVLAVAMAHGGIWIWEINLSCTRRKERVIANVTEHKEKVIRRGVGIHDVKAATTAVSALVNGAVSSTVTTTATGAAAAGGGGGGGSGVGNHSIIITSMAWDASSMRLFSGDVNGKIVVTYVAVTAAAKAKVFFRLFQVLTYVDSYIVQLDVLDEYLLVSTLTRCMLVRRRGDWNDGLAIQQVGTKSRDGIFGACFSLSPDSMTIFSARPGSRVWEASLDGTVISTLNFKKALLLESEKPSKPLWQYDGGGEMPLLSKRPVPLVTPDIPKVFSTLIYLDDGSLLTWRHDVICILDPVGVRVTQWRSEFQGILDVSVLGSRIFVLHRSGREISLLYYVSAHRCVNVLLELGDFRTGFAVAWHFYDASSDTNGTNCDDLRSQGVDSEFYQIAKELPVESLQEARDSCVTDEWIKRYDKLIEIARICQQELSMPLISENVIEVEEKGTEQRGLTINLSVQSDITSTASFFMSNNDFVEECPSLLVTSPEQVPSANSLTSKKSKKKKKRAIVVDIAAPSPCKSISNVTTNCSVIANSNTTDLLSPVVSPRCVSSKVSEHSTLPEDRALATCADLCTNEENIDAAVSEFSEEIDDAFWSTCSETSIKLDNAIAFGNLDLVEDVLTDWLGVFKVHKIAGTVPTTSTEVAEKLGTLAFVHNIFSPSNGWTDDNDNVVVRGPLLWSDDDATLFIERMFPFFSTAAVLHHANLRADLTSCIGVLLKYAKKGSVSNDDLATLEEFRKYEDGMSMLKWLHLRGVYDHIHLVLLELPWLMQICLSGAIQFCLANYPSIREWNVEDALTKLSKSAATTTFVTYAEQLAEASYLSHFGARYKISVVHQWILAMLPEELDTEETSSSILMRNRLLPHHTKLQSILSRCSDEYSYGYTFDREWALAICEERGYWVGVLTLLKNTNERRSIDIVIAYGNVNDLAAFAISNRSSAELFLYAMDSCNLDGDFEETGDNNGSISSEDIARLLFKRLPLDKALSILIQRPLFCQRLPLTFFQWAIQSSGREEAIGILGQRLLEIINARLWTPSPASAAPQLLWALEQEMYLMRDGETPSKLGHFLDSGSTNEMKLSFRPNEPLPVCNEAAPGHWGVNIKFSTSAPCLRCLLPIVVNNSENRNDRSVVVFPCGHLMHRQCALEGSCTLCFTIRMTSLDQISKY